MMSKTQPKTITTAAATAMAALGCACMVYLGCSEMPAAPAAEPDPDVVTVSEATAANIAVIPEEQQVIRTSDLQCADGTEETVAITDADRENLFDKYRLPALLRMDKDKQAEMVDPLQVMKRAVVLGYDPELTEYPELRYKIAYNEALASAPSVSDATSTYDGSLASELNAMLRNGGTVVVTSDEIEMDEPLSIPSETAVAAEGTRLVFSEKTDKGIIFKDVHDASVSGFVIDDPNCSCAVFVNGCRNFSISDMRIMHVASKPVAIIGENEGFQILDNEIAENEDGGILINGNTFRGVIEGNDIHDTRSSSNFSAGITLGSVPVEDTDEYLHPFTEPDLDEIVDSPHDIVVVRNRLVDNMAQGCYTHGAYSCYFVDDIVKGNQKEGICLDYGALGCYVSECTFTGNGTRAKIATEETKYWMLPGISLDNAAYNVLMGNTFRGNAGSGIKAVRSSCRNLVLCNSVTDNNRGVDEEHGAHFFGVEFASDFNPDREGQPGMDFSACYENIIARNSISGSHYAGVFLGEKAHCNDVFDNIIMGCTNWSIEDHSELFNSAVNNIIDTVTFK